MLNLEIDHIDNNPMNNLVANLQVLCEPCNRAKAVAFRRTQAEANGVTTPPQAEAPSAAVLIPRQVPVR